MKKISREKSIGKIPIGKAPIGKWPDFCDVTKNSRPNRPISATTGDFDLKTRLTGDC